jgi:hypothetical protein
MSTRVALQHFVSTTEPTAVTVGDEWYNPATGILYKRIASSLGVQWVNISGLGATTATSTTTTSTTATETISPLMLAGM